MADLARARRLSSFWGRGGERGKGGTDCGGAGGREGSEGEREGFHPCSRSGLVAKVARCSCLIRRRRGSGGLCRYHDQGHRVLSHPCAGSAVPARPPQLA